MVTTLLPKTDIQAETVGLVVQCAKGKRGNGVTIKEAIVFAELIRNLAGSVVNLHDLKELRHQKDAPTTWGTSVDLLIELDCSHAAFSTQQCGILSVAFSMATFSPYCNFIIEII